MLFFTNFLVAFNQIKTCSASKKASLTVIYQCLSATKLNLYCNKTGEKATESKWNNNEKYINVQIQSDIKRIGFRKKLNGHRSDSEWTGSEYKRMDFLNLA